MEIFSEEKIRDQKWIKIYCSHSFYAGLILFLLYLATLSEKKQKGQKRERGLESKEEEGGSGRRDTSGKKVTY